MKTTLLAIGGALKMDHPIILQEFVRLAGGATGQVAILTTASSEPDTGEYYQVAFQQLSIGQTRLLDIHDRQTALDAHWVELLRGVSGIFITGGDQLRLSAMLGGTPVEQALLEAFHSGVVVAGTSAGAAILSRVMLASGHRGATPLRGQAHFCAGFGLAEKIIFDQHFRQRDRLGRLLFAIIQHPGMLGVGLDENTAALVETSPAGSTLSVIGQNAVTIVDGQPIVACDVSEVRPGHPVALSGARLHILTAGCTFDLETRQAHIPLIFRG